MVIHDLDDLGYPCDVAKRQMDPQQTMAVLHRLSESTRHFPQAQLPSRSTAAAGLLQGGIESDGGIHAENGWLWGDT